MKCRLDEALKKKMPAEMRRDLATLRFAAALRLALGQKSPALDDLMGGGLSLCPKQPNRVQ